MRLLVAEKKRLLLAAGFEPPCRSKKPDRYLWFVPRKFCPEFEFEITELSKIAIGKVCSFDEAWNRYEAIMKYPRTFHLPWSPGGTSDDKILSSVDSFLRKHLIISEKIDGSNVCMQRNICFARSHASQPDHPSFDAFKALHASIKNYIPEDMQIFGEWVYALHSIAYDKLPQYFLMFGIRVNSNEWLSWNGTKSWADKLGLVTVPELASTVVNTASDLQKMVESFASGPSVYGPEREGVVIRIKDGFDDKNFSSNVAKWVRVNHVQTTEHWKHKEIIKNKLGI
jgi:hypothetical protein